MTEERVRKRGKSDGANGGNNEHVVTREQVGKGEKDDKVKPSRPPQPPAVSSDPPPPVLQMLLQVRFGPQSQERGLEVVH